MVRSRTPEERLDELEAERVRLRADLTTERQERQRLEGRLDRDRSQIWEDVNSLGSGIERVDQARGRLVEQLERGEIPQRRGRAMRVQPALTDAQLEALDWLVEQRARGGANG